MKKNKNLGRRLIFVVFFLTLFTAVFSASYKINDLKIFAEIQKDGKVAVSEQILYEADKINGILYDIDAKGYGELTNLNIFYEEDGKYIKAVRSSGTNKGNYSLAERDELYKIKLYFPLRNEKQRFVVNYILPMGVSVYKDTAQFNRKMVGKNWQTGIKNIEVTVKLPEEIEKNKIYAFGHGPLTGNVKIVDGKTIKYTLKNYQRGEFLEANILFPKEMISEINPRYIKNHKAFDDIMAMEKNLSEEANKERNKAIKMSFFGWIVFGAISCWAAFLGSMIYLKNIKKYKVKAPYGEYFRELPDNYSPAVAGAVVSRLKIKPEHLFATVMDLVRKDILEMSEEKTTNHRGKTEEKTVIKIVEGADFSTLKDYEDYVLHWYIDEMGDGKKVVMEDVEKYIQGSKNAKAFYSKYKTWCKDVEKDLKRNDLVREKSKKIFTSLGILTGFFMFAGGVFLTETFGDSKFMIFTIGAIPFIMFSTSKKRLSLKTEEAFAKWSAFKKFLVDYSNLEEAKMASIHLWEHYFVYAVALGVAEKVAKGYKKIAALRGENETANINMGRYYRPSLMESYMYSRAFRNIERSTIDAVNRSIKEVAKSNMSSASGRGGGFGAGSSGGGGGRGGGGAF